VIDVRCEASTVRAAWDANFAYWNQPVWRRLLRAAIAVLTGGLIGAALTVAAGTSPEVLLVAVVLGLAGIVGGLWLAHRVLPIAPYQHEEIAGVVRVDPSIAAWAADDIPISDLWELSSRVERVRVCLRARAMFVDVLPRLRGPDLHGVLREALPSVELHHQAAFGELEDWARRVGYAVPAELRWAPVPTVKP
jgi:hypothetical protein